MALSKYSYIAITFIAFVLLVSNYVQAQELKRIPRLIQEAKSQKGAFTKLDVFENKVTKHSEVKSLKDQPIDGVVLTLKDMSAINFKSPTYKHLEFRIPQENGAYIDLELIRNDKSFANTIIKNQDGEILDMETGTHYYGIIKGDNESLCAISFYNGKISGFVSDIGGNKFLSTSEEKREQVMFYTDNGGFGSSVCETDHSNYISEELLNNVNTKSNNFTGCVKVQVEVDYGIYLEHGSSTTAYINTLFAQSFTIFTNEFTFNMGISEVTIWQEQSPYEEATTTDELLDAFRIRHLNPLVNVNGNIGHLVSYSGGMGTKAGSAHSVGEICTYTVGELNKLCVSKLSLTSSGFDDISFRTWIITHEMGHLLGSYHTHDCVWENGVHSQIDDCGSLITGNDCDASNTLIPTNSSIMSYCQGQEYGNQTLPTYTYAYGFGDKVRDRIQSTVNNFNCLDNSCFECEIPDEPNGTPNLAFNAFPECGADAQFLRYEACISPSNDVDWYTFTTTSPGEIKVRLTDISLLDNYRIELYYSNVDEFGEEYLEEISKFPWQEWIKFTNVDENSRQFFIKVFDNEGDDSGTYTIELDWDCTANSNIVTGSPDALKSNDGTVTITANPPAICSVSDVQLQVQTTHDNFVYLDATNNYNLLCAGCSASFTVQNAYPGMQILAVGLGLDDCSSLFGTYIIEQASAPSINISPNNPTINYGGSVQLFASGSSTYQWSPTIGLSNPNIYNPIAFPTSTTTYTVTAGDAYGCQNTAQVTVTVDDSQVPDTDNCPTTPSNDDPCGAILLNVEATATYTQGNNYCATNSSIPNLTCDGYSYGDIWYRFTMPPSGFVAITMTKSSLINDMGMGIYTGSCNSPNYYGCFQNTNPDIGLYMPSAVINDIAPGTQILIRLWEFGNNDFGPFGINILDLGTVIDPDDLPDLAVVVNSVSDVTPNQAQNINVNFTVSNNSNVGTTNDILSLMWLSNDPIWSIDDVVFSNSAAVLSGLGGNNSESFNFNDAVPNVEDGLYYVIVTVDVVLDNVYESNEFNNYYAFPVTVGNVEPTGADLRIRNEEVSPYSNVAPGMDIELTCDVENDGNERTESGGRIAFYFSEDDDFEPGIDLFLGYQSFGRLDPGEDSYEDITIEAPQVSSTGSKRIFYYVDYENDVDEYDETNNLDYENINYNTTQPILPDYVGDSITIEQGGVLTNTLVPDEEIIVRGIVINEGSKDASDYSRAYFYYSPDTDFNNNNKYLGYSQITRLDIGEIDEIADGSYFDGVVLGQGYILIILDRNNEVLEEDEFNNRIIIPINVIEGNNPLPDVTIQINEISQYTNSLGDIAYLDLTIENIGNGIATYFYVDFYLSNDPYFQSEDIDERLFTGINFYSDTLQAGEIRNITHPIEIGGANSTGEYFIVAVVDRRFDLSETTKDNNESSIPIYIDDVSCYYIAYPVDRDTFPSIMTNGNRMRIPIRSEDRCTSSAHVTEPWMDMLHSANNETGDYSVYIRLQSNLSDTTRIGHVLVNGEIAYTAVQLGCDDSITSDLALVSNVQNVSCLGASDGMIDIEITGGYPPYVVQWSHDDQYYYWSTHTNPTSYNSLIPRNYTIIVSDQTGCIVSETITITEPTTISSDLEGVVSNSCWGISDGAIQINTQGGTPPYTYAWSNGANTEDIANIPQGTYEVSITDANGCSFIQVHEVTSLSQHPIDIGDDTIACEFIDIAAPSGLSYEWSTGETSQNIRIENSGSYSLIAQTPDGCTGFDTINIEVNQNVFPVSEQTKLIACDGVVQDQFGSGVAIDGDWAVVGAHLADEMGSNSGAAYIFKYENGAWYQHSKLLAFDGYTNDRFGKSVAIEGNTIVIGADEKTYNQLGRAGAAYIYDFDGTNWNFTQKITAPNPASSDYYGFSLDISDDYIVVGARYDDELGTNAGAAYVYKRINGSWVFQEKLLPSDGASGDYFGYDVAIDQNNVIVGAHRNSEIFSHGGAAYIYTFNGSSWIETKVIASDSEAGDYFGYSVDIEGNTAVVGAYLVDNIYNNEGAVYVYEFSNGTWNETQKIYSNNPDSYFGWDVSLDENFLLVSSGSNEGKAYLYQNINNDWIFDRLITAYDDEDNHDFARSLSISGERMIMGAVYASPQNGGAAYLSDVCQGISINHQPAETEVCINTPFSLSSSESNTNWYDSNGNLLQANSNTLNHIATENIEIIMESTRGVSGCMVYDTLNIYTNSPQITNLPNQTKIMSCSGGANKRFGNAVDISDDWAIVGEKDNKAAHIWKKVNGQWEYGQRLAPQIPTNAGYFGADVAIHGNTATVTSTYAYGNRYSELYIYEYNGTYWELSAKFNVPITQYQNHFNGAVDIFDNTAVVGVRNSNGEDFVCVYEKINNEWQQIEILPAPDGATAVSFAFSVSIYKSILAVGARSHTGTGATYIFRKSNDTWNFEELIKGSDTQSGDLFGHAVDVQGGLIVVGAPNAEDESLTNRVRHGIVYAFHYDKGIWQEKGRMTGDYDRDNHGVGSSVGIDGDMIVAGAFWGELAYDGDGIFLFQYDGVDWQKVEKIASEYTFGNDRFGNAVAIDNGEIIAASDLDDEIGTDAGAAYIFSRCLPMEIYYEPDGPICSGLPVEVNYGFTWSDSVNWYLPDGTLLAADTSELRLFVDEDITLTAEAFKHDNCIYTDEITLNAGLETIIENGFETKVLACDEVAGDNFGYATDIDGDWAVITIPNDGFMNNSGAVYVYHFDGNQWYQHSKLKTDDITSSRFGYAVGISGNLIAVGAPYDDTEGTNAGAVYTFELEEGAYWIEKQKILPGQLNEQDFFGFSVAIQGNYLISGAYRDEVNYTNQGSAYVYEQVNGNWIQRQNLIASDGLGNENFGRYVDIGDHYVIVGNSEKDDNATNSGAAYIYEINSWIEHKLTAPSSTTNSRFGRSVTIDGNYAFIGSRGLNSEGVEGIVYKYFFDGYNWLEESVIESPNSNLSEQFGATIDIDGGILLIGAPDSHIGLNYAGTAYIYSLDDGFNVHYDQQISASDYYYQDSFSSAIGVSGSKVIIGSPNDDDRGSNSGSAYIYDVCERIELDVFPDTDICRNTLVQMDVPQNANWSDKYGNPLASNTNEFEFVAVRDSQIVIEYYRPLLNCTALDTISFTVTDPIISTNEYETKITACDGAASDYFGHSTDIYEEWAVVGATRDDFHGNDSGSAHVYRLGANGWELSQKLIPSIGEATDYFGHAVAIYDNTILVSAIRNSLIGYRTGAVFVFEFNGEYWEETQIITPSDLIANENFGIALDLNGNNFVVGAYDDDNGNGSGSVRVYEKVNNAWQLSTKIISSDGSSGDRFGNSVAISEDGMIVVGARYDDDTAGNSGSAYIYNKSGVDWNEQKIVASDAAYNDYFGYDVAIDSNIVIVSAYNDTETYSRQGSVYIFTEVGGVWQEEDKIYAPSPNSNDYFGNSVDIDDEYIIVGVPDNDSLFSSAGIAYIYGLNDENWQHINTIIASDGDYNDRFGYSVSIDDYRAVIGALNNSAVDTYSGAAYIYDLCEFDSNLCPYVQFDLKVLLEGAYNVNTGEMTTTLNTGRGLLPGQTPVSSLAIPTPSGQPYNLPPWNFNGSEGMDFTDESYSVDVVDWLLVSLRSDVDKASELLQFAALLLNDGTIEPVQRYPLSMLQDDEYYIVIEHRNHMGIMTPTPISMEGNMICYDFTLQDSYRDATSVGQKELPSGEWVMLSGDFNQAADVNSYDITGNDKTEWADDNGVFDGYVPADANLNGDINGADKAFWEMNNSVSSRVPKE